MKKFIKYSAGALLALALALTPVLAVVDTTPPSAPTGLTATVISASQINLTWTAATDDVGVAAYIIFRNSSPVGFAATTSFSDSGLIAATAYSYTVKALDTSGNISGYSNVAGATTLIATTDTTAPSAPSNLTAAAISASQINLNWNAATDNVAVASYIIFRNSSPVGFAATTSFSDSGLIANTAYSYTIKALDTSGNLSDYSNTATATTLTTTADAVAPSTPTNLTAAVISDRQINLSWTAATDNVSVTGYTILRNGLAVGTATDTSFSDTGLAAATAYTYTVKALDAAGNASAVSNAVSAATLPANYKNRGHHDDDDDEDGDEDEYEEEYENESADGHEHGHLHGHGQGNAYGLYKNKHHDD